jgi:hypothetical protein
MSLELQQQKGTARPGRRLTLLSEVDTSIYAKGTTPAFDPVELDVDTEARGIVRGLKHLPAYSGEWQFHVGRLENEIRLIERNVARGYGDAWYGFRLSVLRRALELLGVAA